MKILSYIFGAILIALGIFCLCNPGDTFLASGYIMTFLLFVYGIIGIISVILRKTLPIYLLASIPATVIGIISIIRPGTPLVFDAFMMFLFAGWFIVQGITSIIMSIQMRKQIPGWGFSLAMGIISVIIGIYAFMYPVFAIIAIGILIGIFLIETGITMIVLTASVASAGEAFRQMGKSFYQGSDDKKNGNDNNAG